RRFYACNARQLAGEDFRVHVLTRRVVALYGEWTTTSGHGSPATPLRRALPVAEGVPPPIPSRCRAGGALRVLHVIPSVGPARGGPSEGALGTVRALNARGLCAEILTTNDNGRGLLDVPFGQRTQHEGVPVHFFPCLDSPLEVIREFAFSASLTRWLARHLADYDLIHVHAFFSYASTAAMLMARRKRIPYVVRPLGLLCEWSLRQSA